MGTPRPRMGLPLPKSGGRSGLRPPSTGASAAQNVPPAGIPQRSLQPPVQRSGLQPPQSGYSTTSIASPGSVAAGYGRPASGLRAPQVASGVRSPQVASGLRSPQVASGLRGPQGASGLRGPQVASAAMRQGLQAPSNYGLPSAPRAGSSGYGPPRPPEGLKSPQPLSPRPTALKKHVTQVNVDGQQTIRTSITAATPSRPAAGPVPGPSTGVVPKIPSTTTTSKKTERVGDKVVTKTATTKVEEVTPEGKYFFPMHQGPRTKEGRFQRFGSPYDLRSRMDENPLKAARPNVMILPGRDDFQDHRRIAKLPAYKDIQSGMIVRGGPVEQPISHDIFEDRSFLEQRLDPSMIEPDWDSDGDNEMENQMETQLLESLAKSPDKAFKAVGTRQVLTTPPVIMTDEGPQPAETQVITTDIVKKSPGRPEIVGHQVVTIKAHSPQEATKDEVFVEKVAPVSPARVSPPKPSPGRVSTDRFSPDRGSPKAEKSEVVKVVTSVITAPGVSQTSKTVIYEKDQDDEFEEKIKSPPRRMPSPKKVAQIIAEETRMIEETKKLMPPILKSSEPDAYPIRKHVDDMNLSPNVISILEQSVLADDIVHDDLDEPSPEIIANMMNTEERGLDMGSTPTKVYNFLFNEAQPEHVVEVSSAAHAPLHDVVVPSIMPDTVAETAKDPELANMSVRHTDIEQEDVPPCAQPAENVYVANVGPEPVKSVNCARKGKRKKRTPLIAEELPPWGIKDVAPVVDVVGGEPHSVTKSHIGTIYEPDHSNVAEDGIDYILDTDVPTHRVNVQLRGSKPPSWFPGYYLVLPTVANNIALVKSPSRVFGAAWKATQPDIFAEDSMIVG